MKFRQWVHDRETDDKMFGIGYNINKNLQILSEMQRIAFSPIAIVRVCVRVRAYVLCVCVRVYVLCLCVVRMCCAYVLCVYVDHIKTFGINPSFFTIL